MRDHWATSRRRELQEVSVAVECQTLKIYGEHECEGYIGRLFVEESSDGKYSARLDIRDGLITREVHLSADMSTEERKALALKWANGAIDDISKISDQLNLKRWGAG